MGAAAEVTLTGRVFMAEEAVRLGAVNEVVPDEQCLERALELAAQIAAAPPSATLETKRRILMDRERQFGDLFAEEARVFRQALLGEDPDSAA